MGTDVVILIERGNGIEQEHLNKLGGVYESIENLLISIHPLAKELYMSNSIQVWEKCNFMDEWNTLRATFSFKNELTLIGFSKIINI